MWVRNTIKVIRFIWNRDCSVNEGPHSVEDPSGSTSHPIEMRYDVQSCRVVIQLDLDGFGKRKRGMCTLLNSSDMILYLGVYACKS